MEKSEAIIGWDSELRVELLALLQRHGLPSSVTSFVVTASGLFDPIKVQCEFFPEAEPSARSAP